MSSAPNLAAIQQACRRIESADPLPNLASLAHDAGLSLWHFQRIFTATVGVSPKRYAMAQRRRRLQDALQASDTVTNAIYDAGYSTSSVAYRDSQQLGMAPGTARRGGAQERIRYAAASTSLGDIIVASTQRGICMVEFGGETALKRELRRRFPKAGIDEADSNLKNWVTHVVAHIDGQPTDAALPLDIRGTAFQIKVWNALTRLQPGETISYSGLARRIRAPTSTRAVARACATNSIAVLVPCHRVVSSSGELTGYKWGLERKRKLLLRESAAPKAKPRQLR